MATWRLSIERTLLISLLPFGGPGKTAGILFNDRDDDDYIPVPGLADAHASPSCRCRLSASDGLGGFEGDDRLGFEVARAMAVEPALAEPQAAAEDFFKH